MLLQTEEQAVSVLATLRDKAKVIAVDTETEPFITGGFPKLCGVAFHTEFEGLNLSVYLPFRHKPSVLCEAPVNLPDSILAGPIKELLSASDKEFVFFNALFDLNVLEHDGIEILNSRIHDAAVYINMVDENVLDKSLEYYSRNLFGSDSVKHQSIISKMAKIVGDDYSKISPELMTQYAIEDVQNTYKLFLLAIKQVQLQEMAHLLEREMAFMQTLRHVINTGVGINAEKCGQFGRTARNRMRAIKRELGFDPGKDNVLAQKLEPQNWTSFQGRKSNAYPEGIPAMPKQVLGAMDHPIAKLALEYRGHQKANGTWFQGFLDLRGPDGRLHPDFRQNGTLTGRLACRKPNMQQIPRTSEDEQEAGIAKSLVKTLFVPLSPDYVLYEFDYSQIELRLASCYAGDKDLLELFRNSGDMHQLTAEKLNITRYDGKQINFAVQYGAGPRKIGQMLDISMDEARELLEAYWQGYPGMAAVKRQAELKAASRGWVRLWTGRRRHFQFSSEHHKAFNSIIQGGAGEIVKQSMILLLQEFPGLRIVNQVHDSLWCELPRASLDTWITNIKQVMEWPGSKFHLGFPVDVKPLNEFLV